jgi:hypothetical protein
MTPKRLPGIATWMLKRFGSGPNNDVLLGDLAEQYRQNENTMWYWRQAMKAIPVSLFKEVRGHKTTAARALLTGWGLWTLYVTWVFPKLTPYFFGGDAGIGVRIVPSDLAGTTWTVMTAPVGLAAGFNLPFSFAFAFGLPFMVWAVCGWLVARFHRDQQTGVVLLFAGSIFLPNLLFIGLYFVRGGFTPGLSARLLAANAAVSIVGILLGGGLLRDHSRAVSN